MNKNCEMFNYLFSMGIANCCGDMDCPIVKEVYSRYKHLYFLSRDVLNLIREDIFSDEYWGKKVCDFISDLKIARKKHKRLTSI